MRNALSSTRGPNRKRTSTVSSFPVPPSLLDCRGTPRNRKTDTRAHVERRSQMALDNIPHDGDYDRNRDRGRAGFPLPLPIVDRSLLPETVCLRVYTTAVTRYSVSRRCRSDVKALLTLSPLLVVHTTISYNTLYYSILLYCYNNNVLNSLFSSNK